MKNNQIVTCDSALCPFLQYHFATLGDKNTNYQPKNTEIRHPSQFVMCCLHQKICDSASPSDYFPTVTSQWVFIRIRLLQSHVSLNGL